MISLDYSKTLVPESAWRRMDARWRSRTIWVLWAITLLGLGAGMFDARYWRWVVVFASAHALLALAVLRFRPLVFPAQLRIAYAAWVALGTFVPGLTWMMYVTTAGLAANLAFGYCPLARMLYLLPWNREEPFDAGLPLRVFLAKPVPGRFRLPARSVNSMPSGRPIADCPSGSEIEG
jgi:hypothetical protein